MLTSAADCKPHLIHKSGHGLDTGQERVQREQCCRQGGNEDIFSQSELEKEIAELARQLTCRSTHLSTSNTTNPFSEEDKESSLHPGSPSFPVKDWIRSLLVVQASDSERFRHQTAGVAFGTLSVYRFGSPTDSSHRPASRITRCPVSL